MKMIEFVSITSSGREQVRMTLAAYDGGENEITGHREEGSYFMGARLHLFEDIKIVGSCITLP
jgi:hypothetical protein